MNTNTNEIAGATLDVEFCQRHNLEFPIWLHCPRCSEEREGMAFANHYARKRFENEANLRLVEVTQEQEIKAVALAQFAEVLERHAPLMFTLVLIFFLVTGNLMCSHNRTMDAQVRQMDNKP